MDLIMLLQYKNFSAQLAYSANTKSYHGEFLGLEDVLSFQASSREHAMQIMHRVVDEYLLQQDYLLVP